MSQHIESDSRPQVVFTRDFREFIRGQFDPGKTAAIRYDPFRIVPDEERPIYRFSDPEHPVVAHLRYNELGPVIDVPLETRIGVPGYIEPQEFDTYAPMLKAYVTIPDDAAWVSAWFSYKANDGRLVYDSNFGKNYRMRFYRNEINILKSMVGDDPARPLDELIIRIETDPVVERLIVRYRVVNSPTQAPAIALDLHRTGPQGEGTRKTWETQGVSIPDGAVVAYDIVYFADGRPFKDDNQGNYFLACHPEVLAKAGY